MTRFMSSLGPESNDSDAACRVMARRYQKFLFADDAIARLNALAARCRHECISQILEEQRESYAAAARWRSYSFGLTLSISFTDAGRSQDC
jgi:hypothetical protein